MIGNRSKLIIGIKPMSLTCRKCTDNLCPKNYEGSSKGMEATKAARIVKRLLETFNVYIVEYVSDDGSSCRKILTHSYRELILEKRMTEGEWPRNNSGRRKPDNGLLPVKHPAIKFLADKGHRVRSSFKKTLRIGQRTKSHEPRLYVSRRRKNQEAVELDPPTQNRRYL